MESLTATRLRENIYAILDQVLATGEPVQIVRNGRTLRIVADVVAPKKSKLDNLKKRDGIIGNPDDLVYMDWSSEWSELKPKTKAARR